MQGHSRAAYPLHLIDMIPEDHDTWFKEILMGMIWVCLEILFLFSSSDPYTVLVLSNPFSPNTRTELQVQYNE